MSANVRHNSETMIPKTNTSARPVLKWAGGKTQLLPEILKRLPERIGTYHEPFVGGGAVFFALASEGRFRHAVLSDTNLNLISLYVVLREQPEDLIARLLTLSKTHSKEQFYEVRRAFNDLEFPDLPTQAARFLYLNKTCFNGLYRVNRHGEFNVPFGDYNKNPTICDADNLRAASRLLRDVDLVAQDFGHACDRARRSAALNRRDQPRDCVYLDPPYLPRSKTANFTAYSGEFSLEHHHRLAGEFSRFARGHVPALLSNSDTPETRELYREWTIETVSARRSINSKGTKRGAVSEVLVSQSSRLGAHQLT